ncbi:hypothetical protein ESA94_07545 [Lacibacter luteus]|uniref:Uncharacterized protein n=1 Tax=Lacibacter luteus TaxID=2508719 RepID=A0A4Q1CJ29_9BACT|nr:hypothetical protein [Lacibacter luteus]RXK60327.1 hypothetical protein ESA94_07545 [Lacibacter luteus]
MLHHQLPPQFNNTPVRLSKKGAKHADSFIRKFFGAYHLHEIRRSLAALTEIALTTNNTHFDDAKERDCILWFYYELEIFIEAAWFQNKQSSTAKTKPKKKNK